MKRLFFLLLILSTFSIHLFAQDANEPDEYPQDDDVYIYDSNGAGDRFVKINLGAIFPLNFKKQLKIGGDATLGFYKFFTKDFAFGGELSITYNQSIGEKILISIPLTLGIMYQPTIGNFEFPLFAEVGLASQTWQNIEFFPALTTKVSAGAYYRFTDAISVGLMTDFMWIPQWVFKDPSKNYHGLFETATIGLRYHF